MHYTHNVGLFGEPTGRDVADAMAFLNTHAGERYLAHRKTTYGIVLE